MARRPLRSKAVMINGVKVPFIISYPKAYAMSTGDLTCPTTNGMYICPDVEGDIKVLTLGAYEQNDGVIDDDHAITLYGRPGGVWDSTPVIKIYETGTTAVNINYQEIDYI